LYKYQKQKENRDRLMGHGRLYASQAKMGSELGDYGMARILQYLWTFKLQMCQGGCAEPQRKWTG